MSVRFVSLGCTDAVSGEQIDNPSWEDVETLISQMDGDRHAEVGLMVDDDRNMHMLIGGGEKNQYILNIVDDDELYQLKNPNGSADKDIRIFDGQGVEYPEDEVVGLADVLRAARWYFEHNKPDPSLQWGQWGE